MAPKILTSFQEIESEWMGMLPSSPVNTLFLSPQWQQVWWENFGDGKTMAGFYVPSPNGVDAIASLTCTGNTLAFLGSQETVDYNDFMVRQGFEAPFFEVLLGQLEDQPWEVMQLDSLVETSPTLQHLPDLARERGYSVEVQQEDTASGIQLPATWDDYLAVLSKKNRHELRRKFRRLEAQPDWRWYTVTDPDEVSSRLDDFLRLMRLSSSDKAEYMTADREKFFRNMSRRMAEVGVLRLYFMEFEGAAVAASLCFDYASSRLLYNSGYNPDYGYYSVGLLLNALCLQEAIEQGLEYFDFLRGSETYKQHLGGTPAQPLPDDGKAKLSVDRVAFISFHACPLAAPGEGKSGGMNVYVKQLAIALAGRSVQVDVFTREHPGCPNETTDIAPFARVIHLPGGDPDAPVERLFPFLPEFSDALLAFQRDNGLDYQAVHTHYWLSGWVGRELSHNWRVPHVTTFHTLAAVKSQSRAGEEAPETRERVEQEVMATADRVVAFTPHERDAMVRLYQANANTIDLIPCGVDLSLFRPLDRQTVRRELGINGEKVLLYVGRLEPLKGPELLLHTAAQLEKRDEVRFLVVGGGVGQDEDVDRMRFLAAELNVGDLFDFVGRVDQQYLPKYYNAADVCVVPSYYESFGLVALESMACGTPVVAARVGGLSTIVQHARTGYLTPLRCPETFADSVEMIISNKKLQHSMGVAARQKAEGLGWDNVAALVTELYAALVPGSC